MRPEIRPLGIDDAESAKAVAASLPAWFNAAGLRGIAKALEAPAGFGAWTGSGLRGFILWKPQAPAEAELTWMGVSPDRRGKGIGTALLGALVRQLHEQGFASLDVSTVADNVPYEPYVATRAFYRARGFRDLRVDPLFYGEGADRYDRLVLRLALR